MTTTINPDQAVVYCVILADGPVDDVRPYLPADLRSADRDNIPLTDRDGNTYTGRVVKTGTRAECEGFLRAAFGDGQAGDGTPIDGGGCLVVGLDRMPRGGKVHFTRDGR